MKKLLTICGATLLLLGANQANAQDWLQADFEIPVGGTEPVKNGWSAWDPTSYAIIENPEVTGDNNSGYVYHFKNAVQWDIAVNYWIDPALQTNIYSGVKLKVYVTVANNAPNTGSKVSCIVAEVSHKDANGVKVVDYPAVTFTTPAEVPVGAWTEVTFDFAGSVTSNVHRELRFKLDNYGSQAYYDDITFIAKTSGVVNQTGITVTGAGGATEITTDKGTLQMSTTVSPADATDKNVYWSVSDKTVADIDGKTGILTAKGNGTVDVIAKSADLQKLSTTAPEGKVTITVSNQLATGIKTSSTLKTEVVATSDMLYANSPKTIKQATVYNITGTEVANQVVNNKTTEICISALTNGIYILKLQSEDNEIELVKFVKK